MIFWTTINIATAIIAACCMGYSLAAYYDHFTRVERGAMGAVGASMLLRIGPILGKGPLDMVTPYDDWSVSCLHIGIATLCICVFLRIEKWRPWRHSK